MSCIGQNLVFERTRTMSGVNGLRILFVHSGSDLYGASRSLLRLSSRLVSDGAEVTAVLPHRGPLQEALFEKGVRVVIHSDLARLARAGLKSSFGVARLLREIFSSVQSLRKLIVEFKPHIVHTITSVILSSGVAATISRVPHVQHVRESFGEFGGRWKLYQFYLAMFSTRIICVSTPIADQFTHGLRTRKVEVIHNGFPRSEFENVTAPQIRSFKEKFSLENASHLVGVVGRIKYLRKGQEVFVRAAARLKPRFPQARFLCIGSPFPGNESHLSRLLELIKEQDVTDYVLCTGDVDDVKAALASLDVAVLSSVQPEPFAGVVIEAMALGRPVVATAIGGSLEQVADGVTGFLVEPGNPESMAHAIGELLESTEQARLFGQNGRRRFLERFEFELFYQKMLSLYEKVMTQ
jgi:glycosyltransferase involved in cell wall biosynthesis